MSIPETDYFTSRKDIADLRRKSVRAAGLSFIFNFVSTALQTVGVIVLARMLLPHEFGLVEMVAVFAFPLQAFSVDGFSEAVIQKEELGRSEINAFFWMNIAVSAGLALLLAGAGPLIAWFYGEPQLLPLALVFSLSVIAAGLGTQHTALLKRNFYFYEASFAEFLGGTLSLAIALVMALVGAGYWALAVRRVVQPAISSAAAWIYCRWRPSWPSFSRESRGLAKFGLNIWGNVSLHFLRENVDTMFVGRAFGAEVLGHYGRAYHFSRLLPGQVAQPVAHVALSTLSSLAGDPDRYRHYFARILDTLALVAMLAACLLTVVGPDLLTSLLGPQWSQAGVMFAAFAPGTGIAVLYKTLGWLHMSLGRPQRWWQWSIAATVVTIVCYLIALLFGPIAVAAAYSISMHLLILPALWFAGRPLQLSVGFFVKPIWRHWVAALATCLVVFGLGQVTWGGSPHASLSQLVWLSAECTAMYALLVVLLHGGITPFRRLFDMLFDMRHKRTPSAVPQAAS
jgi:PST family polysaccharide transporter